MSLVTDPLLGIGEANAQHVHVGQWVSTVLALADDRILRDSEESVEAKISLHETDGWIYDLTSLGVLVRRKARATTVTTIPAAWTAVIFSPKSNTPDSKPITGTRKKNIPTRLTSSL